MGCFSSLCWWLMVESIVLHVQVPPSLEALGDKIHKPPNLWTL